MNRPTDEQLEAATIHTASGVRILSLSRLWRDENMKKQHQIPLGSIVEVEVDMDNGWGPYEIAKHDGKEICIGIVGKLRMYVVKHSRDCDGTPLYSIASKPVIPPDDFGEHLKYDAMVRFYMHGIDEENIKVVVDGKHIEVRTWEQFKAALMAPVGG